MRHATMQRRSAASSARRSFRRRAAFARAALRLSVIFGGAILLSQPAIGPMSPKAPVMAKADISVSTPLRVAAQTPDATVALAFAPTPLGQSAPLGPDFVGSPSVAAAEPPAPPLVVAQADAPAITETDDAPEVEVVLPAQSVSPLVAAVPEPPIRPAEFREPESRAPLRTASRQSARRERVAAAAPAVDNRSFFEKFFGVAPDSSPALGYAAPEESLISKARPLAPNPPMPYDRYTAVYDITAHTVYMPDGTRLEAHSGLGDRLDDPRYVHERMRGPTPPHVYSLTLRESLFHGVRALRLNPSDSGRIYGRNGLLAHTYMLGPNGDSNGCVSFRNYDAFLQAFLNGEIKRLAVVVRRV